MARKNKPPQKLLDELFYELYLVHFKFFHRFKALGYSTRDTERELEVGAEEAGYRGTKTGLMSKDAYRRLMSCESDTAAGLPKRKPKLATEHPITFRVITVHCLDRSRALSKKELTKAFLQLVTVQTTPEENQKLKKDHQCNFKFGDCWREMYAKAGIELIERPELPEA